MRLLHSLRCPHTTLTVCPSPLLSSRQAGYKSFIVKRKLAVAAKRNKPVPQWFRMKTDSKIKVIAIATSVFMLRPPVAPSCPARFVAGAAERVCGCRTAGDWDGDGDGEHLPTHDPTRPTRHSTGSGVLWR